MVYALLDNHEQAAAAYQQAVARNPDEATAHASLARELRSLGRIEEARFHLQEARRRMEGESAYDRACIMALSGELDAALDLLQQALQDDDWPNPDWVRQDPDLRALHGEPRFQELLAQRERQS